MRKRERWMIRIKEVERHFRAAAFAADHVLLRAAAFPDIVPVDLQLQDLSGMRDKLEETYFVRLFAEFESGLRQYWATLRDSHPKMQDLLNAVASRRKIPFDMLKAAHDVRDFRNALAHEHDDEPETVALKSARAHLCLYFSYLPANW